MNLKDKMVVLTGATGGIGSVVAAELAREGARLIAVGRDANKLDALLQSLPGSQAGLHLAVRADLNEATGISSVVKAVEQAGGMDVLINNAGVSQFTFLEQESAQSIESQIHINLVAPILLTQALLPWLLAGKESVILNVGSTFGSIGFSGFSSYCASKFGLRGFTESLRRELADTAIRVLYFAPRATQTAINSPQVNAMNKALGNQADSPETVAKNLLQMLRSDKENIRYIGWPEKLFVRINALLPGLVDKAMLKQLPIIRQFARHSL